MVTCENGEQMVKAIIEKMSQRLNVKIQLSTEQIERGLSDVVSACIYFEQMQMAGKHVSNLKEVWSKIHVEGTSLKGEALVRAKNILSKLSKKNREFVEALAKGLMFYEMDKIIGNREEIARQNLYRIDNMNEQQGGIFAKVLTECLADHILLGKPLFSVGRSTGRAVVRHTTDEDTATYQALDSASCGCWDRFFGNRKVHNHLRDHLRAQVLAATAPSQEVTQQADNHMPRIEMLN